MTDDEPTPFRFLQGGTAGPAAEVYRCRVQREELLDTDLADVKFCGHCAKSVFRVTTINGFTEMVASGRCVWIESADRSDDDFGELLGTPDFDFEAFVNPDPILFRPVNELELRPSLVDRLNGEAITLIGDLIQRTDRELLSVRGLGYAQLNQIKEVLSARGLILGMKLDNWPPQSKPQEQP